jgi:hypothetical protein
MEHVRLNAMGDARQQSKDLAKLIVKLRWIGMEEEARRVERVMRSLPPEERGTVCAEPFSTD